ncbi:MAG: hypothetical protein PHQ66_02575 [Candidatus Nanoarchaeia archaeon]|nr:hypothetical protein [Candidatus Nanoarchaeia archaeon]MDD5357748.1 hypothetical protein [Candidatus Nanoarchaeia archaeon]MDD5588667.1 hypothetical protein [Candidatus Nanoarchaeia archaeon]
MEKGKTMKSKKSLVSALVLAGLSLSGCSRTDYNLPNEEKVRVINWMPDFWEDSLTITKTDGRIIEIKYSGNLENPYINSVNITKDKLTEEYTQPEVLEGAKKEFAEYYKKITEAGLKDLQ